MIRQFERSMVLRRGGNTNRIVANTSGIK
uniref:Uncharacterized protein n=1 Tax=Rhizophora mucronata TaxID=61149 RepID=A0A2P2N323_RHIMU